ncbi:MAG: DUF456 domain-containing protein [Verrucomicrobiota bacterium]
MNLPAFFTNIAPLDLLWWSISILLIFVGLLGVFLPAIPGPFLIVAGVAFHKYFLPQYLTWWTVGGVIFGAILCALIDWVCLALGIKLSGASQWGLYGACVGFMVGIFLGPFGVIIGTVLGAMAGEFFVAQKEIEQASIAGIAAGAGILAATVLKLVVTLLMILAFALDCFLY